MLEEVLSSLHHMTDSKTKANLQYDWLHYLDIKTEYDHEKFLTTINIRALSKSCVTVWFVTGVQVPKCSIMVKHTTEFRLKTIKLVWNMIDLETDAIWISCNTTIYRWNPVLASLMSLAPWFLDESNMIASVLLQCTFSLSNMHHSQKVRDIWLSGEISEKCRSSCYSVGFGN